MSYSVRTASTGSGASVQGYPSGPRQVVTSVKLQSGQLEMGGGKSRAEKNTGKKMYNKMRANYASDHSARSYSKKFAEGAMHEDKETRERMNEEIS